MIDDARYAENRAAALAGRGAGDALIRHDLRGAGVADEIVERALGLLEAEPKRAERVVRRRGASARTARYLAAKGFANDAIGDAVAHAGGEGIG